jgi:hypothetical protein
MPYDSDEAVERTVLEENPFLCVFVNGALPEFIYNVFYQLALKFKNKLIFAHCETSHSRGKDLAEYFNMTHTEDFLNRTLPNPNYP